ncbi:hypothetical protein PRK78_005447 [Emydomyces testavorans]|uniref:C6 finger domain transcription factor nscR n=1 Tax=Emydomyces testavorans TaxID=2070801 RepID=A0AAF0IJI6_9EURO|nr:hypothetical protein PRK78_005447 [Emydomyces testavorans]
MSKPISSSHASSAPRPSKSLPPNGRRRDKAQLSLRCDRIQPCQNCAKRGQSCVYVHSAGQSKPGQSARQYPAYLNSLHDRIHHLEGVVLNLVSNKRSPGSRPVVSESREMPGEPHIIESVGRLSIGDDGTTYLGSSTWQAILDEIGHMKDFVPEGGSSPFSDHTDESDEEGVDLLLGAKKYLDTRDLYDAVPPRAVADSLYEAFWNDPGATSVMWLGILFAVLSLASNFLLLSGVDPERAEYLRADVRHYRQRCAQCLIAGDYTKPGKYNLPALILYLACERMRKEEFDCDLPVLFSMIVSLAMRMGYHRDASHYPNISPFDGEMRRRIWAIIAQLDLTVSIGVGLPRLINDYQSDNAPPRNLREEDFSEDSTELPPARPAAEPTMVTYIIARMNIIKMVGKITDLANTTIQPPYETIMEFDRDLYKVYEQLPTFYKLGGCPETDDPVTFLQRLSFESLYEQARCTLHRKYLTIPDSRYAYSREACVDAAMRMLSQQRLMHQESQPGRMLFSQRWKLLTYLNRENLLATMIVCLDVGHSLKNPGTSSHPTTPVGNPTLPLEAKIKALEQSQVIWEEYRSVSKEASTAATVVDLTIRKAKKLSTSPVVQEAGIIPGMSNTSPVQGLGEEQYPESPIEYPPTTQYMMPISHGVDENHQYGEIKDIVGSQPHQQQQQAPQFQYSPVAMYQQPPMVPQESTRASLEPFTTGMSLHSAYRVMETMIDGPVNLGWGAMWDGQFSREFPVTTADPPAECAWDFHNPSGFPPATTGPPLDQSVDMGYPG